MNHNSDTSIIGEEMGTGPRTRRLGSIIAHAHAYAPGRFSSALHALVALYSACASCRIHDIVSCGSAPHQRQQRPPARVRVEQAVLRRCLPMLQHVKVQPELKSIQALAMDLRGREDKNCECALRAKCRGVAVSAASASNDPSASTTVSR